MRPPELREAGLHFSQQALALWVGTTSVDGPEAAEETSNASADAVYRRRASGRPQAQLALVRQPRRLNRLWSRAPTFRPVVPHARRRGGRRARGYAVVPRAPPSRLSEPSRPRGTFGHKCDPGIIVGAGSACFRFAFDQLAPHDANINLTRRIRRRKLKSGSTVEQVRFVLSWRDPRTGEREQRFFERQRDAQERRAELVAAYDRGAS